MALKNRIEKQRKYDSATRQIACIRPQSCPRHLPANPPPGLSPAEAEVRKVLDSVGDTRRSAHAGRVDLT